MELRMDTDSPPRRFRRPRLLILMIAAAMLLALVRGAETPKDEVLPTELLVRRSCGHLTDAGHHL